MNNWTLEDYKDYYHERAGIQSESFGNFGNLAEMQASNATLDLFKKQEKPDEARLKEYHQFMKNKNN